MLPLGTKKHSSKAPVLTAAGANVTVYDISEKQLKQDQFVAVRNRHLLTDLSALQADSFDDIINPIFDLYTSDINAVWRHATAYCETMGRPSLAFEKMALKRDNGLLVNRNICLNLSLLIESHSLLLHQESVR